MLWFLLTRLLRILTGDTRGVLKDREPHLLLISLILSWIGLMMYGFPEILLVYPYIILLHLLVSDSLKDMWASLVLPISIIVIVAGVFTPFKPLTTEWYNYLATVGLRIYGMASTGLIVYKSLGPVKFPGVFGRRIPLLHDVLLLFYRIAPQTVEDAMVSLISQKLIGNSVREILVSVTLTNIRRMDDMKISFYMKGANPNTPRTRLFKSKARAMDIILVLFSVIWLFAWMLQAFFNI